MSMNRMVTPKELGMEIAANLKKLRKQRKLSQIALAEKAGVSYGSMKRFEQTGEIALESLLKIAIVLGETEPFEALFKPTEIKSIQEIIDGKL